MRWEERLRHWLVVSGFRQFPKVRVLGWTSTINNESAHLTIPRKTAFAEVISTVMILMAIWNLSQSHQFFLVSGCQSHRNLVWFCGFQNIDKRSSADHHHKNYHDHALWNVWKSKRCDTRYMCMQGRDDLRGLKICQNARFSKTRYQEMSLHNFKP
jgi:hypothetical protein